MHPVEVLRLLARSQDDDSVALAAEAGEVLASLASSDPEALVPACRRLLDRHVGCVPLWWVAARVLSAADPVAEGMEAASELWDDPTHELLDDLVGSDGRRVLLGGSFSAMASAEVAAIDVDGIGVGVTGRGEILLSPGARSWLRDASELSLEVWLVAGAGRMLPSRLWTSLAGRVTQDRHSPAGRRRNLGIASDVTLVSSSSLQQPAPGSSRWVLEPMTESARVLGPVGLMTVAAALKEAQHSCPEPAALLGGW